MKTVLDKTSAKVIAASLAPNGCYIFTMELMFSRTCLAEFNTHRAFSRNSQSSRAVPVSQFLTDTALEPFIPLFTRAQKGMTGIRNTDKDWQERQERRVLGLLAATVATVNEMLEDGVHKQDANRYLEPFAYHRVIVTGTQHPERPGAWSNFFALRTAENVYPAFQLAAKLAQFAYEKCIERGGVVERKAGQWHLPYVTEEERATLCIMDCLTHSVARCARVSTLRHTEERELEREQAFVDGLVEPGHFSPTEHQAQAQGVISACQSGNFYGWEQYRKCFRGEFK